MQQELKEYDFEQGDRFLAGKESLVYSPYESVATLSNGLRNRCTASSFCDNYLNSASNWWATKAIGMQPNRVANFRLRATIRRYRMYAPFIAVLLGLGCLCLLFGACSSIAYQDYDLTADKAEVTKRQKVEQVLKLAMVEAGEGVLCRHAKEVGIKANAAVLRMPGKIDSAIVFIDFHLEKCNSWWPTSSVKVRHRSVSSTVNGATKTEEHLFLKCITVQHRLPSGEFSSVELHDERAFCMQHMSLVSNHLNDLE